MHRRCLQDASLLDDPRYIAEPKFDRQRAQLHIERGGAVACYSRPGRDLLLLPGLAWLRALRWPARAAVLDGELLSGTGMDGIDGVLTARQREGGDVSFMAFDLLELGGDNVMAEPWSDRRKRLEDVFAGIDESGASSSQPSRTRTGSGRSGWSSGAARGIVLKDRRSSYKPGVRACTWWKAKHKLTLPVEVLACSPHAFRLG